MNKHRCDVVVIGLGAMGSSTLMHLAKAGVRCIGIDQFSPPHERGSSHGETRITRESIAEGERYIPWVRRSHELWRVIEAEAGVTIRHQCGGLFIDADQEAMMHGVKGFGETSIEFAQRHGIEHQVLTAAEVRARFPEFSVPDGALAYLEPGAGFVYPEVAIKAQLEIAGRNGAVVLTNSEVTALERLAGGGVKVVSSAGVVEASVCLVSAGAWVKQFLPNRVRSTFALTRQVLHWVPIREGSHGRDSPVFIWAYAKGESGHIYGFPSLDGKTIKVAAELPEEFDSPQTIDRTVSVDEQMRFYNERLVGRLACVRGAPLRSCVCLYTVVPHADFVVEYHPTMPEVLVASCCSGHGFKHSPALGEAFAALLRGVKPALDPLVFQRPDWHEQ